MALAAKLWVPLIFALVNCYNSVGDPDFGWKGKSLMHSQSVLPTEQVSSADSPVVTIETGSLRGFISETIGNKKIVTFTNVPYAQPPLGSLRFQPPVKVQPWNGVRDATRESVQCIQVDIMTRDRNIRGQEDCLYLQVHTPLEALDNQQEPLPVMVYAHGGGFASGSSALYGPLYLLDQNVVLVTINYRLGPFGFLSTGDSSAYGNAGMKDQVLALKWVQENIAHFGGNPNLTTLVGQSAGAASVQHHIVSPASKGLFHRAISHSGGSLCWWAISENAKEYAVRTGELFGCHGNSQEMVECLQGVPAQRLVTAHTSITGWANYPIIVFAPVIEPPNPTAFLTEHPAEIYEKGNANRVPWITGQTTYEMAWLFAELVQDTEAIQQLNTEWDRYGPILLELGNSTPEYKVSRVATLIRDYYLGRRNPEIGYKNRYQISQMLGDRYFLKCQMEGMYLHRRYTQEPVYSYEFSFEGKYSIVEFYGQNADDWGSAHLDDIIYLLNNTEHYSAIRRNDDSEEYRMMEIMTSAWANFARYGVPYLDTEANANQVLAKDSTWQPIQMSPRFANNVQKSLPLFNFLDLNLNPKMIANPYLERYHFWLRLNLRD